MRDVELTERARAIAGNRTGGASELLSELLPLLEQALRHGRPAVLDVARLVCAGQVAMAPLWNACASALANVDRPERFAARSAEMARAPRLLERAAALALGDVIQRVAPSRDAADDAPRGNARVITLSYSHGVASVLARLAMEQHVVVICGQSLPGGEGERMCGTLKAGGASAELVEDALLTTYLDSRTLVVVGADAISARDFTNKAGTLGLVAAASFTGSAVYVVASRDKAQSTELWARVRLPRAFERTPIDLVTLFLTEAGPLPPTAVLKMAGRFQSEITQLLAQL